MEINQPYPIGPIGYIQILINIRKNNRMQSIPSLDSSGFSGLSAHRYLAINNLYLNTLEQLGTLVGLVNKKFIKY